MYDCGRVCSHGRRYYGAMPAGSGFTSAVWIFLQHNRRHWRYHCQLPCRPRSLFCSSRGLLWPLYFHCWWCCCCCLFLSYPKNSLFTWYLHHHVYLALHIFYRFWLKIIPINENCLEVAKLFCLYAVVPRKAPILFQDENVFWYSISSSGIFIFSFLQIKQLYLFFHPPHITQTQPHYIFLCFFLRGSIKISMDILLQEKVLTLCIFFSYLWTMLAGQITHLRYIH